MLKTVEEVFNEELFEHQEKKVCDVKAQIMMAMIKYRSAVNKPESGFCKFVDEWYELWPSGVKSGHHYVKSDKKGCFKKLGKFVHDYPEYSYDTILKATERYLNKCSMEAYKFIKFAPFFVSKDGVSVLEGWC